MLSSNPGVFKEDLYRQLRFESRDELLTAFLAFSLMPLAPGVEVRRGCRENFLKDDVRCLQFALKVFHEIEEHLSGGTYCKCWGEEHGIPPAFFEAIIAAGEDGMRRPYWLRIDVPSVDSRPNKPELDLAAKGVGQLGYEEGVLESLYSVESGRFRIPFADVETVWSLLGRDLSGDEGKSVFLQETAIPQREEGKIVSDFSPSCFERDGILVSLGVTESGCDTRSNKGSSCRDVEYRFEGDYFTGPVRYGKVVGWRITLNPYSERGGVHLVYDTATEAYIKGWGRRIVRALENCRQSRSINAPVLPQSRSFPKKDKPLAL